MWTGGLKNQYHFNNNTYWENHVAYSGNLDRGDWKAAWFESGAPLMQIEERQNTQANLRATSLVNHKINAKHKVQAGVIYSRLFLNFDLQNYNFETSRYGQDQLTNDQADLYQGFASWQYRPTDQLTINTGMHATLLGLDNQTSVEPRWNVRWQAAPRHVFAVGQGLHSRAEGMGLYFTRITNEQTGEVSLPNQQLRLTQSLHNVLSHQFIINPKLSIKTEAYYQHLYNVPVGTGENAYLSTANFIDDGGATAFRNGGQGRNYGVETSIEHQLTDGFYFLTSHSVFRSQYDINNNGWKDTRYDNRFVSNVVMGKEWPLRSKNNKTRVLETNLRVVYAGGLRYTPLNEELSKQEGYGIYDDDKYLSQRAPNFFRPDFSIGIRTERAKTTHTLKLDLLNVSNIVPKTGEYYDPILSEKRDATGLGLLPNLYYRVQF